MGGQCVLGKTLYIRQRMLEFLSLIPSDSSSLPLFVSLTLTSVSAGVNEVYHSPFWQPRQQLKQVWSNSGPQDLLSCRVQLQT